MTNNREWRGTWWIPGSDDHSVSGTLRQADDGGLTLRLIGGFSISIVGPNGWPDAVAIEKFPVILGVAGGTEFTLVRCRPGKTSGGRLQASIEQQDVHVGRALAGVHVHDPTQPAFMSMTVSIEYLLGWMQSSTLKVTGADDDASSTGKTTAGSTHVDDLTATRDGFHFTLGIRCQRSNLEDRPRANARSLADSEWAELTIRSAEPTTFDGFDRMVEALTDLMTLTAHAPAGIIEQSVWFSTPPTHPAYGYSDLAAATVYGKRIHQPRAGLKETEHVDYLFTVADISFAEVLPKWLDLHDRAHLACNMLFGLRYVRAGYNESRLLTAATAAESLHRALFPDATIMAPDKFEALRARVMKALAGRDTESRVGRSFVSDNFRNDPTFRARLLALADIPDAEAVSFLIHDVPTWAKYVKELRNGVAHGNEDALDKRTPYIYTLEITIALLGLVMMSVLGLPPSVQQRAVGYLWYIVERFNADMAGNKKQATRRS